MDTYTLGAQVPLTFAVYDPDGDYVAPDSATLTVTLPDGTTTSPTLVNDDTGIYSYDYPTVQVGPHSAVFVATGANGGTVEDAFVVTAVALSYVTTAAAQDYLRDTSWDTAEITDALAAERSAQTAVCRIDPYTPDLREALLRRVQCNLARRSLPLGMTSGDSDVGSPSYVPGRDPEVRRLERPYLRLPVG